MSAARTTWPVPGGPVGVPHHGAVTTFSHIPTVLGLGSSLQTFSAWPSANLALYVPIEIQEPFLVNKISWINGGTLGGSIDAGVYSMAGTLLCSTGATAQSGSSARQTVDVTDYLLMAGNYFIGILDTATSHVGHFAASLVGSLRAAGIVQEATSGTLPVVMTPATMAQTVFPLVALISDTRLG